MTEKDDTKTPDEAASSRENDGVVWLTPHILGLAIAFAAGGGIGYYARGTNLPVEARPQARAESPHAAEGTELPGEHGPEAHAQAAVEALSRGDYARAAEQLEIAHQGGLERPAIRVFRGIAAEGKGDAAAAAGFVASAEEKKMLRDIAREAFTVYQDFAIAGPAYQLYLRVTPESASDTGRPMMRQAVEVWRSQTAAP